MEPEIPTPQADPAQLALIQKKLNLDSVIRNGVRWFFWIAGLSLVNSIVYLLGGSFNFIFGLGATQVIDGFMTALAQELGEAGGIVRLVGFVIDIVIAGVFVVLGVLGRKRKRTPIIAGMVLYALDGILLLALKAFLAAGFHAFALIGIAAGLKSIAELTKLEEAGGSETIESLRQRMPVIQSGFSPPPTPAERKLRWILIGLILLVVLACAVVVVLTQ